jgi:hypothetical protein
MMNINFRRALIYGIFLLFALNITGKINGQLLQDTSAVNLIRKGIDFIYSQEFSKAENILIDVNTEYPEHPATYLYKAIVIYYQNYPLIPSNPLFKSFEYQLRTSMRICEAKSGWLNDPEKLLIDFCSRGLLMLCYSENGMSNDVTSIALTTYKCVRKSFQYKSVYPDFCYFTGLYNYYREAYPDRHPVYKAIAILFPRGNKSSGLEDLQFSAENSIVLKAETYSILSWIYFYYENNYPEALKYSKSISDKYPANLLFRGEYIKNLLLTKNYDEAEKILLRSENEQHTYFRGELSVFNGFLQEMKYSNFTLARRYYEEGISTLKRFGTRSRDYTEFGSDGLRRIRDIENGKRSDS